MSNVLVYKMAFFVDFAIFFRTIEYGTVRLKKIDKHGLHTEYISYNLFLFKMSATYKKKVSTKQFKILHLKTFLLLHQSTLLRLKILENSFKIISLLHESAYLFKKQEYIFVNSV
jgi:hypothetical protein